ncbi:hypothetical protein LSH36_330g02033 [Paralvinella palmiformis]|uniref:Uncharacterized protein n=1 Tax=Paralvinella palmiformis TaxID=53620 RepID=A0AAD9JGQ6_9ANNE|nr:hypothetical protein LSH36_330g02033 [Paralvinella palmiformis]
MLNAVDAPFGGEDELPDISHLSIDDSLVAYSTPHPRDVDDDIGDGDSLPNMGNDDSLPDAVGGDSLPGAVGGDSLPGAVGGDSHPDMGNDDSLPDAVGGDSLPGAVGGDSLPGAVGGDSLPGAVGGDSLPGAVGGDSHPDMGNDDSLPDAVGGDSLPGAVGGDSLPGAVGGDSLPGAVGGDSLPGAVGGDSLPGAVGGDCHPGTIGGDSLPSAEPILHEEIMGPHILKGICFLPDGKLVVGSKRSFEVFKTDRKRTYCKMDILCLSAHPMEQVIIIAGDEILQEWKYNGTNYQMTKTVNINCRPVDVVALENERVVVLDKTNIYMYENKERRSTYRLEQTVKIKAMCIDKSGRYIVGFTDKVESRGGDWMSMFSSKGEHDFQLQDLCIDSMDNIFVCDIKNKAVLKFDKEGHFIGRVVKTDGIPFHIAMYQDKMMAVHVKKNNSNFIYKYRL